MRRSARIVLRAEGDAQSGAVPEVSAMGAAPVCQEAAHGHGDRRRYSRGAAVAAEATAAAATTSGCECPSQ